MANGLQLTPDLTQMLAPPGVSQLGQITPPAPQPTAATTVPRVEIPAPPKFQTLPRVDVKAGIEERQRARQPLLTQLQKARSSQERFEREEKLTAAEQKVLEQEGTLSAQKKYAQEIKLPELRAQIDEVMKQYPKAFVPTQESAKDLSQFFGLLAVVGFSLGVGGKRHALQAMNAMNGMLEGHQKGREDFYKQERQTFETNVKALKGRMDMLLQDLKLRMDESKYNYDEAVQQAKLDAAKYGADFVRKNLDRQPLETIIQTLEDQLKVLDNSWDKLQQRALDTDKFNTQARNKVTELVYESESRARREEFKAQQPKPLKKGETQAMAVAEAIGRPVDPQAANTLTAGVQYINDLNDLKQRNIALGNVSGITVGIANNINRFLQSRAGVDGKISQQDLIDASAAMEQSKDFSALSDKSKVLAKQELNAIMTNLQLKYGNRAPVAEFRAAQQVLSRGQMTATAYNTVMDNEIRNAESRLAASGFTRKDVELMRQRMKQAFEDEDEDSTSESGQPTVSNW